MEGASHHYPALKTSVACLKTPSPRLLETKVGYALYHANARLVRIVPDDVHPNMWRMLWPDGRLSDMANLSRIKDAAAVICEREAPGKDRLRFHWKREAA
jgi:hypothetical protein